MNFQFEWSYISSNSIFLLTLSNLWYPNLIWLSLSLSLSLSLFLILSLLRHWLYPIIFYVKKGESVFKFEIRRNFNIEYKKSELRLFLLALFWSKVSWSKKYYEISILTMICMKYRQ